TEILHHLPITHNNEIKLDYEQSSRHSFWPIALTAFYSLAWLSKLLPNNQSNATKVPTLKALSFEKANSAIFARIQLLRTKTTV
ncbi:24545_t:CDS:1, partial [Dentiscutata erythropus]